MTTTTFQRISERRTRSGNCPVCDKRVTRSNTFEQTINPWNRNEDGTVKTPIQVRESVRAEADAWVPNFTHNACEVSR